MASRTDAHLDTSRFSFVPTQSSDIAPLRSFDDKQPLMTNSLVSVAIFSGVLILINGLQSTDSSRGFIRRERIQLKLVLLNAVKSGYHRIPRPA